MNSTLTGTFDSMIAHESKWRNEFKWNNNKQDWNENESSSNVIQSIFGYKQYLRAWEDLPLFGPRTERGLLVLRATFSDFKATCLENFGTQPSYFLYIAEKSIVLYIVSRG